MQIFALKNNSYNFMKKYLLYLLLIGFSSFAQTKQQLIDSIIKINELQDECRWMQCREWEQYRNWQRLLKQLSTKEVVALSKNDNPVVRMYATRELVLSGKGDAAIFFLEELKCDGRVVIVDADLMDEEYTYNIVYHDYWNKIRIEARNKVDFNNEALVNNAMEKRVEEDIKMFELDSIILAQDNTYWLLYARAFSNRKFAEQFLPRIEELAFKHNNAFALDHLHKYYYDIYQQQLLKYWREDFMRADFTNENGVYHYNYAIQILLEDKDKDLKQIAVTKLKTDRSWENDEGWFENTLKDYGLTLEDVR